MDRRLQRELKEAYCLSFERFGHQNWWPGETDFEICVGAILTQNTAWTNVEKAIQNLKNAGLLSPQRLYKLTLEEIAIHIKPSGYFNIKAKRLKNFINTLVEKFEGNVQKLLEGERTEVRHRLLAINGIGKETSDSMMLYAGHHLIFVVDAYTRRIFSRHEWCSEDADYDEVQAICENNLNDADVKDILDYWQDYHAQLVMIGKNFCKNRNPKCDLCPLKSLLKSEKKWAGLKIS
ncbi:MAG: endonuclease III domain-containing protein [Verrucomicrobiae bacterium]|nr:endonuclease III domain-containing protein [Verrucomicrobiae bacterium]